LTSPSMDFKRITENWKMRHCWGLSWFTGLQYNPWQIWEQIKA